jgi:hypothetical protein
MILIPGLVPIAQAAKREQKVDLAESLGPRIEIKGPDRV